jgi:hypothetical protein
VSTYQQDTISGVLGLEHKGGWLEGIVKELRVSGLPLNAHSNGYEAVHLAKTGAGLLFGFSAYSSNVAAQFIQVFDSQTAPASGQVPDAVFTIATIGNLAVSYIFPGRFHKYGIWIANSTTGPTYTAGAADTFFDVQFV